MTSDTLLDLLLDLKHDLGKHLQLPLALLPKDADARAFQRAAREGLTRTRRGPDGDCSARRLWSRFVTEAGETLQQTPGFAALEQAVERALSWEKQMTEGSAADCHSQLRQQLQRDFRGVAQRIAQLIEEVSHAGQMRA